MDNVEDNTEEILNQFSQIKHKIIFFFMPENVVFEKPKSSDDPDWITLKSISPLFYWCSAHEFPDFDKKFRYLIQYQTYSIENHNIIPNEVLQKWCSTKYQIRDGIISFLDMWTDHKRLLLNTILNKDGLEFKKNNQLQDFSTFASFVAKSIFDLKHFYIKQTASNNMNFDVLQKEFWKMIALNSSNNFFDKKELEQEEKKLKKIVKKTKNIKTKKANSKKKQIKNGKAS